ncbi:MAG: chemotaxis-specific protein-glutamate methyltransferase CheB [Deltaproteobacteria bacterium]|nr:chemotaxis-specific protein-glutamate methyltransferase CheB [Deltaproteobacteria bacterium]
MEQKKENAIKILIVDDSMITHVLLKRMLSAFPGISVVGTAKNGQEALSLIPVMNPDVISTDLHMPVMDGLAFVKEVMEKYPRPILVVSVSVQKGQNHNIFSLLEAGALDVFPKPRSGLESEYLKKAGELAGKIKILAGVRVFRKTKKGAAPLHHTLMPIKIAGGHTALKAVCIGASTGGPQALNLILSQLPSDFPLPIVCIQHISEGFLPGLIEWLRSASEMKVEMAQEGGTPLPGVVYFPMEGAHLVIDDKWRFGYSFEPPLYGHRPSITVTFRSIAERCGAASIGVILTGMGQDGAEGLKDIRKAGGITMAQDEKTSVVFGMPRHAIEIGAAGRILPVDEMAAALIDEAYPAGRVEKPLNHSAPAPPGGRGTLPHGGPGGE